MERKLFDADASTRLDDRRLIDGPFTGVFNLSQLKYQWAFDIYKMMLSFFWVVESIDLTNDRADYVVLSDSEREAFDKILSFLTFLDSVQTDNLPNFSDRVTAPELKAALTIQAQQEVVHSEAYAAIISTICEPHEHDRIYSLWKTDPEIRKRNNFIAEIYETSLNEPSDLNYARAIVANYLLEGIYFFNSFMFFFNLAHRGLMKGTSDMIRIIARDEGAVHCALFERIIKVVRREKGEDFIPESMIYGMVETAVEKESEWSRYAIGDGVVGISNSTVDEYTKYLGNERLKQLGLGPIYDGVQNPYPHLERIADWRNSGSETRGNFFETNITSYVKAETLTNWKLGEFEGLI